MKARWQERELRRWAPTSVPVIMIDEPYLAQMGSAFVNIPQSYASRYWKSACGLWDA